MSLVPMAAPVYTSGAHLSQFAGPLTNQRYAIVESIGLFKWYANDVTTADNLTVIAPSGGALGRWKLSAAFPGAPTWLPGVDVVATSNLDLTGLETIDGVSLTAGMVVLPTAQDNAAQNVPMVVAAGAWTRPTWFDTTAEAVVGAIVPVKRGTSYGGTIWQMTSPTSGSITLGTTEVEWGLYQPIALSDASPESLGSAAAGVSESVARADHVHSHGALSGGTLHSAASTSTAGFMSAADKTRVDAVYPSTATIIRPSGNTNGVADNLALRTVVGTANGVAVLESAAEFYDDGTPIVYASGARVIFTDERPPFWRKGTAATSSMNAVPGCINTTGSTITMNLAPAANWPDRYTTIETTGAITATIEPNGSETIGVFDNASVGGAAQRLVLYSRGTAALTPVEGGSPSSPNLYSNAIFGVGSTPLVLAPGAAAGAPRERNNIQINLGDLRVGESFIKGTAIFFRSEDGVNLMDHQIFGSGSATGFIYWREAYTEIGYRIQLLSTNPSEGMIVELVNGGAPFQVVAAQSSSQIQLSTATFHLFQGTGAGAVTLNSSSGQQVRIQNNSTTKIEANATGIGFNASTPVAKGNITGSRANPEQALANLLTYLASRGDITNSTTA